MNVTEIKKALYKEKPTAERCGHKSGGFTRNVTHTIYSAKTSLGEVKFEIPQAEMFECEIEDKMPAQLLIRWLVIPKTLLGIVVFYEPNYENKTVKEIGRTKVMPYSDAINVYAETPNPASQMVKGETEAEITEELKKLELEVQKPEWLKELFDCI